MNPPGITDSERTRRLFWTLVVATAVFKLVTAAVLPLTEDEAYFMVWGRHPAFGYYDHGPMTGWLLYAMMLVSDATVWVRLPAVVFSLVVAVLMRRILKPVDPHIADWVGILWLLSPANLLSSLITTDTPLLLLSVLSVVTAIRAARATGTGTGWWLLSGLWLGAAFLSKYFAVLTGVGIGVWLLFGSSRPRIGALALVFAGAIPGIAVNVAWNYANGWPNFLFNLMTRNEDAGLNLVGPFLFVVFMALLTGPLGFSAVGRRPSRWRAQITGALGRWKETGLAGIAFAGFVPVLVLGAVALVRDVGLHWLLSFVPWVFVAVGATQSRDSLERLFRPAVIYALVQVAVVTFGLVGPVEVMRWHRSYGSIVLAAHPEEVIEQLKPMSEDAVIGCESYGRASLLEYHLHSHVPVFGVGSYHGRQDDWYTDFREFDGRDVVILTPRKSRLEAMKPWFAESEIREIKVRGAVIYALCGRKFRIDAYYMTAIQPAAEQFYKMPTWLKKFSVPSVFLRRYGLDEDADPAGH